MIDNSFSSSYTSEFENSKEEIMQSTLIVIAVIVFSLVLAFVVLATYANPGLAIYVFIGAVIIMVIIGLALRLKKT